MRRTVKLLLLLFMATFVASCSWSSDGLDNSESGSIAIPTNYDYPVGQVPHFDKSYYFYTYTKNCECEGKGKYRVKVADDSVVHVWNAETDTKESSKQVQKTMNDIIDEVNSNDYSQVFWNKESFYPERLTIEEKDGVSTQNPSRGKTVVEYLISDVREISIEESLDDKIIK